MKTVLSLLMIIAVTATNKSAVFCGFLRFPAVSCENLRFSAKICVSQMLRFLGKGENLQKSAKICV